MAWQSKGIAGIQVVFAISLLPAVFDSHAQIPRESSFITACGLFLLSIIFTTLHMKAAVMTSYVSGVLWAFLFIFRPMVTQ